VARIKPVSFDDRLTLVEHLDELRSRIVVSVITLVLAIALCFWQRDLLLEIANRPLPSDYEPFTFSPPSPSSSPSSSPSTRGCCSRCR